MLLDQDFSSALNDDAFEVPVNTLACKIVDDVRVLKALGVLKVFYAIDERLKEAECRTIIGEASVVCPEPKLSAFSANLVEASISGSRQA